jgi:hypothetical protein
MCNSSYMARWIIGLISTAHEHSPMAFVDVLIIAVNEVEPFMSEKRLEPPVSDKWTIRLTLRDSYIFVFLSNSFFYIVYRHWNIFNRIEIYLMYT